jgi:hypothetical protein
MTLSINVLAKRISWVIGSKPWGGLEREGHEVLDPILPNFFSVNK